jgi:hypothetical protein
MTTSLRRTHIVPAVHWRITARDEEILTFIERHGIVTSDQISRKFFGAPITGSIRVRKLVDLGLLERRHWQWKGPMLIRLTRRGASLLSNEIAPAPIVQSRVRHSLALVDLLEEQLRRYPEAEMTTERELRRQRHRAIRDGRHEVGRGRIPDGMLTFPDGRTVNIELEITPKRSRLYGRILRALASEPANETWFFVPSQTTSERLRVVAEKEYMSARVRIAIWRPSE